MKEACLNLVSAPGRNHRPIQTPRGSCGRWPARDVAILPSGMPVLKTKADGWRRSSNSSQWRRGLRLAGRDDADMRLRGRHRGTETWTFSTKQEGNRLPAPDVRRGLVSAEENGPERWSAGAGGCRVDVSRSPGPVSISRRATTRGEGSLWRSTLDSRLTWPKARVVPRLREKQNGTVLCRTCLLL